MQSQIEEEKKKRTPSDCVIFGQHIKTYSAHVIPAVISLEVFV